MIKYPTKIWYINYSLNNTKVNNKWAKEEHFQ